MNNAFVSYILYNYETFLKPYGFEIKPFLLGWYNEKVDKKFHLKFSHDTLAINIINTPYMFEKTFLPFVKEAEISFLETKQDLLDESIDTLLNKACHDISKDFAEKHKKLLKTIVIRDYEMDVTRQPKILVQTSGHVSGQVRYYQRMDIAPDLDPWPKEKKIYGCSFHHEYGGWFALRGIIIFPDFQLPDLEYCEAPDPLQGNTDQLIRLLNEYNFNWKTWQYRNVIDVKDRYSRPFITYLSLPPGEQRLELLKRWRTALLSEGLDINDITNEKDLFDWGMG